MTADTQAQGHPCFPTAPCPRGSAQLPDGCVRLPARQRPVSRRLCAPARVAAPSFPTAVCTCPRGSAQLPDGCVRLPARQRPASRRLCAPARAAAPSFSTAVCACPRGSAQLPGGCVRLQCVPAFPAFQTALRIGRTWPSGRRFLGRLSLTV
eukprot:313091-Chlamydomonas_euryale.AAC.1